MDSQEHRQYEAEEGCLSLDGTRRTTRYQNIEIEYRNAAWKKRRERYSGWIAQIIQHEMDHLDGVIIYYSGVTVQSTPNSTLSALPQKTETMASKEETP